MRHLSRSWLGVTLMAAAARPAPPPTSRRRTSCRPRPDLPDPLTMLDGTKVTTEGGVGDEAPAGAEGAVPALHVRPLPAAPAKVSAKVLHEDRQAFGGKATLREVDR